VLVLNKTDAFLIFRGSPQIFAAAYIPKVSLVLESARPGGVDDAMVGAWGWFRANLSAFSVRCFHQISFPGIGYWWSERESNPHLPLARRLLSQLSYRPNIFISKNGADGGNRTRAP
jgi:hypothetical protein